MKKSVLLGLCLIFSFQFIFQSCQDTNPEESDCITDMNFSQICTEFDRNNLEITQDELAYFIVDNSNFRLHFEQEWEAERAIEIIQKYELDEYCSIGKDGDAFYYFLSSGEIPAGELPDEDCIPHEVCDLKVELTFSGKYTVVEGDVWHYASESEETALQVLNAIQHFQSSFGCFVGRPHTNMHYLRKASNGL